MNILTRLTRPYRSSGPKVLWQWSADTSQGILTKVPHGGLALNIVLAFGYMQRAESSGASSDDWQKCLGHVKNAMNVVTELFMRTCDLLAVKRFLGWQSSFMARQTHNLCSCLPLQLYVCHNLLGCTSPTPLVFRRPRSKNGKESSG